jgi:hypothetical protein
VHIADAGRPPCIEVANVPGKGRGVVAARNIQAMRFLGTYPGHIFTKAQHDAGVARGELALTYMWQFWDILPDGTVSEDARLDPAVVDPRTGTARMAPQFAGAVLPFVNEPSAPPRLARTAAANAAWVYNLPGRSIDLWSTRGIRKGEEVTACYGEGYERNYKHTCTRQDTMRVIRREGDEPLFPYDPDIIRDRAAMREYAAAYDRRARDVRERLGTGERATANADGPGSSKRPRRG